MYNHQQILPLSQAEREALDTAVGFPSWLRAEIFTKPHVPMSDHVIGAAAFVTGGVSGLVTYYLAGTLMQIFGANVQVGSAIGVVVFIPRFALGGNALQDWAYEALHAYRQRVHLPRKNNQAALRNIAKAFVYVSSGALGMMGGYILWTNLPYSVALRAFFLPSILIANAVVNIPPFLEFFDDIFAHYSPGKTPEIRLKRSALLDSLNIALHEIRGYDYPRFVALYEAWTAPHDTEDDVRERWKALLALAENPVRAPALPKSFACKARGYFGWLLSFLSSLTNIQISDAEAAWLSVILGIEDPAFKSAFSISSSLLCSAAYTVLCAGPTQAIFENYKSNLAWEASHPCVRHGIVVISLILGFASAIPNASWPVVLGDTPYEQCLAGPAFISPGALYMSACSIFFNRLLDGYERWRGKSRVIDHQDFRAKLESLSRTVAQVSDETIDGLVPLHSPLLRQYRARHAHEARTLDNKVIPLPRQLNV